MDPIWREELWRQFGAAIDMLENAIEACPDELWDDRSRRPEFWYLAYHTLFYLDLYLSDSVDGFAPPSPFTLGEMDPAGVMPARPYTKDELRSYLTYGRRKCRSRLASLTNEWTSTLRKFSWGEMSGAALLLYNMRHVQHHAAQLNLILRQTVDAAPRWVASAKQP
jgi:hypothetical protein